MKPPSSRAPWRVCRSAALAAGFSAACAHAPSSTVVTTFTARGEADAPYLAVHVDHLQTGGLQRFTDARRRWLAVLAAKQTTDGRGLFLQTGDSGFLSVRPLRTLGDLDRQPALSAAALVSVDPRERERYDAASDALLAPPHRTEIWRYDPDLSLGVTDPTAALSGAAWGKMTVEEIDPTPAGEDYARVWKEVRTALAAADYPLVRVAYWSRYGTGDLVTFWLSKSQQEFLRTASAEATVAGVVGAEAAEALFARQRKVVLASDSVDVIPRLDLSSKAL
jgi:hypothetical protein